jgi:transcriptional regulator with XRE-family HTH domain
VLRFDQLHEGMQVRLARVAAGLTLFEVGVRASVSPSRLSEFERGRGSLAPDAVARIHEVLCRAHQHRDERARRAQV